MSRIFLIAREAEGGGVVYRTLAGDWRPVAREASVFHDRESAESVEAMLSARDEFNGVPGGAYWNEVSRG